MKQSQHKLNRLHPRQFIITKDDKLTAGTTKCHQRRLQGTALFKDNKGPAIYNRSLNSLGGNAVVSLADARLVMGNDGGKLVGYRCLILNFLFRQAARKTNEAKFARQHKIP